MARTATAKGPGKTTKKAIEFKPKKRTKSGSSKKSAEQRRIDFANAYIANGQNGLRAAIAAGFSPNGAGVAAARMLKQAIVQAIIADHTAKAAQIAGLNLERTLLEVARLAYSDPRKLFNKDGKAIPIHELDDDAAAMLASVEVDENFDGHGEDRELVGFTKKIKVWDKNAALEKAMKFHGLYEKDNKQNAPVVMVMSGTDAKL